MLLSLTLVSDRCDSVLASLGSKLAYLTSIAASFHTVLFVSVEGGEFGYKCCWRTKESEGGFPHLCDQHPVHRLPGQVSTDYSECLLVYLYYE